MNEPTKHLCFEATFLILNLSESSKWDGTQFLSERKLWSSFYGIQPIRSKVGLHKPIITRFECLNQSQYFKNRILSITTNDINYKAIRYSNLVFQFDNCKLKSIFRIILLYVKTKLLNSKRTHGKINRCNPVFCYWSNHTPPPLFLVFFNIRGLGLILVSAGGSNPAWPYLNLFPNTWASCIGILSCGNVSWLIFLTLQGKSNFNLT